MALITTCTCSCRSACISISYVLIPTSLSCCVYSWLTSQVVSFPLVQINDIIVQVNKNTVRYIYIVYDDMIFCYMYVHSSGLWLIVDQLISVLFKLLDQFSDFLSSSRV